MDRRLHILILEDVPTDAELMERELQKAGIAFLSRRVDTREDFIKGLDEFAPDLILADQKLPAFDGLSALKTAKERCPDVPFIFVTGSMGEEWTVETLKKGAMDYVLKDKLYRLVPAVVRALEEVAERTRAEEALRGSEKRYKRLVESVTNYIYTVQIDNGRAGATAHGPACAGVTGYRSEEYEADPYLWYRMVYEEDRNAVIEQANKVISGEAVPLEHRIVHKNGEILWIKNIPVIRYDEHGHLAAYDGLVEDITERKKAEEEIRDLTLRLNAVVEHMPQGVFLLNGENRIIHANPLGINYLAKLTGAKTGDALTRIAGRPVEELLISPPQIMWHEIEIKEPSHLIFEVAGRALKDDSGTVFVIRDVTEEKKSKEKIQSQERLAAVGQLSAGIAHDFSNFLTGIIGYADLLLLDTNLDLYPETKQMAESIGESGRSAANLIRQILDFSRKSVSEMKLIDLKPLIKEFLKLIKETIPENIRVSYSVEKGNYMVNADLTKIQQAIANLAVNARDAMPEGGELKIGLAHVRITDNPPFPNMPSGDWIAVTVSDTGTGIPNEVLPHIFEPFFTTKEYSKGTGLGLAQVYGIVKQHAGYIDVKTEVGRGATFIIHLPPSEAEEEITSMEKETIIPKGGGETILIIEDDHSVRDLLNRALTGLGYKVLTAKNGREGLNIFDSKYGEIGLIITDMIMPEMGGIELSREIKRKKPSVRILGITGYDFSAKKEEIINAGIEEMLQKPFNLEELAQTVANALG